MKRFGLFPSIGSGIIGALLFLLLGLGDSVARAQTNDAPAPASTANAPLQGGPVAPSNSTLDLENPVSVLQNASRALSGLTGTASSNTSNNASPETPGSGGAGGTGGGGGVSAGLSILLLLTVLSLAPAILIMTTSFTRIVIVLSLLRQAMGTQSLPPSQVIVGLAMFMSLIVMEPTFNRINREAIIPMQANQIDQVTAWNRAKEPLRDFMFAQIDHAGNWDDITMLMDYRGNTKPHDQLTRGDVDMVCLIPAFILSELKVSFLMGFRLYLPFLIIDMVISSVLISMGMMMLPPTLISMPFKLLLFVMVDGWRLVVGNLLHSFVTPATAAVTGAGGG